ncbi:MAG: hypothetical protein N2C14_13950 [Planctomycetales bacterium]
MSLDNALAQVLGNVPECVAAGYVDMATGMLLGVKTVDSHPQEVLDLVAAGTADIFQGPNVSAIEKMFRKSRGVSEDGAHYFKEIVVFSEGLLHVFLRGQKNKGHATVVVCRASANIGMVLTKTRGLQASVEATV